MRHFRRQGFTLLELLVVIGILSVLVSLLLPAVQMAREASRRAHCQNNMKQIGIALHNYHDLFQVLPLTDTTCAFAPARRPWSWIIKILPQMDQASIYQAMQLDEGPANDVHLAILKQTYPAFLCPTDPYAYELREERFFYLRGEVISQSDYASVIGDYQNIDGIGELPMYGYHECGEPIRGMVGHHGWSARFADVTDGLSNTFCVGECVGAMSIQQNWGIESWGTTAYPINWANDALTNPLPTPARVNPEPSVDASAGFRSFHPGGCNFMMGDGSVRFVSEAIDGVTYRALASRAGGEVIGEF